MPKRRPARTGTGQGRKPKLTKQQLSLRSKKGWKTKFQRYHYASEDESVAAYLARADARAKAVREARQNHQQSLTGWTEPKHGTPNVPFRSGHSDPTSVLKGQETPEGEIHGKKGMFGEKAAKASSTAQSEKRAKQQQARATRLRKEAEDAGINVSFAVHRLMEKEGVTELEALEYLNRQAMAKKKSVSAVSDEVLEKTGGLPEEPVVKGAKRDHRRNIGESEEQAIFGKTGFGSERSIEDLVAEGRNQGMDFADILEDPSIRTKLRAAGQEGDLSRFRETLMAQEFAEKRAKRMALEARHGRELGWAGDYEFTPQESQFHNRVAHIMQSRMRRGRQPDVGQMQDSITEALKPLMPHARPHEIEGLAGDIVSYKLQQQGGELDAPARLAILKKAHSIGNRATREGERLNEYGRAAEFEKHLRDLAIRESQGEIKPTVLGSTARYMDPDKRIDVSKIKDKTELEKAYDQRADTIYKELRNNIDFPTDLAGRKLEIADAPNSKYRVGHDPSSQTGSSERRDLGDISREIRGVAPGRKSIRGEDAQFSNISDNELKALANKMARFQGKPGSKEHNRIRDHLDSVRVRSQWEWDPTAAMDSPILRRGPREGHTMPSPPQRSTRTSDAFYKGSGHEEGGLRPKGIKNQFEFVKNQQLNRLNAIKTGDYYMGVDAKGKAVSPERSRFGVTANKQWEYTTPTGKRKTVEFADKRTDESLGIDSESTHTLARKFDDTINVKLGTRRVDPEYDQAPLQNVDKDIVVPLLSQKKGQEVYRTRNKHVYNPEKDTIESKREVTRVRYMPWEHTTGKTRQDADQIAIKVPGKGMFGERVIYANIGNDDTISNVSKFALGTSRARDERRKREMSERVAWMRETDVPTTKRLVTGWDDVGKASKKARDVEPSSSITRAVQGYGPATKEGRLPFHEQQVRGDKTMITKAHNFKRDAAGAGVAWAGLSMRKRLSLAGKQMVNKGSASAARKSPFYKRTMDSWSMKDYKLIDVKEGVVRPLGETVANYTYMAKHPTASISGATHGLRVDTGYYRDARFMHPARVQGRQVKKLRVEMERLYRTEKQFEKWSRYDAPIHEKVLANRLDPRKRTQEYRRFTRMEGKMDWLDKGRRAALTGFDQEAAPSGLRGLRQRKATRFAQGESHKLQKLVERIEKEAIPEWAHTKGGNAGPVPKGFELVHLPGGGRMPPHLPPMGKGGMFDGFSRNQKFALAGAGTAVAVGAGAYAWHRHKKKQEIQQGLAPQTFLNRYTPGPVKLPLPYARTVQTKRIGSHAVTDELSLTGRKIPTRFGVGVQDKYLWKGAPKHRGYDPSLPVLGGFSMRTPRAGKTTGKIFRDPNEQEFRRLRSKGSGVYIGGKRVARVDIQTKNQVKLKTKNPNALSTKDKENLINVYGLSDYERSPHTSNWRSQEDARRVRDFFTSGVSDQSFLRKFDDPDEVRKIRRKKYDNRQNIRGQEVIREVSADGEITWRKQPKKQKKDKGNIQYSKVFDWTM